MHIYFDNAATTPLYPQVKEVMIKLLDEYGNASALYSQGFKAAERLEKARCDIAQYIGAKPEEVYFTSGGSESDTQALMTIINSSSSDGTIITSNIEHSAVLNTANRINNEYPHHNIILVPCNHRGFVKEVSLQKCFNNNKSGLVNTLVSIMMVNNEIGTIQDIKELTKVAHWNKAIMHTDATQAMGHIPIDVSDLNVDMLSASAHKFHGPKGVGFLYCKSDITPYNLICGGSQERGRRAGTENVAGIVGMAEALKIATRRMEASIVYVTALKKRIEDWASASQLKDSIFFNTPRYCTAPGILNISFVGLSGQEIQSMLNERNISISTGSACHSGENKPSHVLQAIDNTPETLEGAIRISLSEMNTMQEVEMFLQELEAVINILTRYN